MSNGKEQLNLQYDAGQYLREIRLKSNVSLSETACILSISKAYLSEIEKGIKLPSDSLIRALARHYKIDESDLFIRFGKTPMLAIEQLSEMPGLQKVLAKIKLNNDLTDEQKQTLYNNIEKTYKDFIQSLDKND